MIYAALLLFLCAALLFWLSGRQKKAAGLPEGRVVSSDTGVWGKVESPLYDPELGLTGKPDYLVQLKNQQTLIPVEVKSTRAPTFPYDSHVYQLAAYCLLVEADTGIRPPYGMLQYRDRTFTIDYLPELEQDLRRILEEMRHDFLSTRRKSKQEQGISRSHEERKRCDRCGYRAICTERL